MKAIYLFVLVLMLTSLSIMSQSLKNIDSDKVYKFKFGKIITRCSAEGVTENDTDGKPIKIQVDKNREINVDRIINDEVIFTFLWWSGDSENAKSLNAKYYENTAKKRMYFKMPRQKFLESVKVVEPRVLLEFGTATIPIKIRPGDGEEIPLDFYGNFNAGIGMSIKFRNFINLYGGISLTSVPVDSITTKGVITSPTNASALTPTMGIIKEVGNVQIGGFVGWDFLSRNLGKNWIYQGRPWYGVGIGFNIFTISRESKEEDTQ
ncbi:hypothetical protein [Tenacibaculum larymnensis]|uniref:Outer membrane protein beta-barrel domain-containing protein n=1 Tax=Tenacibaculum larymnensis TaxID=2878201 RepID=A0A9X4EL66_9FLAO|nr:hypothetical protein [Tenacibaculum larymnensis]MDE1206012.1 hypothetical protein [Tenacibaculum larymnensis]